MKKKIFALLLCALTILTAACAARAAMSGEEFISLCESGSVEDIRDAINGGADVNAKDNYGWTALTAAAVFNEDPEVIMELINAGADVNPDGDDGGAKLMAAAMLNKNPEVAAALLKAGVNIKNKDGGAASGHATKAKLPEEDKGKSDTPAAGLVKVTVAQLAGEFFDNPFRAEQKWRGRDFIIQGEVSSIEADRSTGHAAIVFRHRGNGCRARFSFLVPQNDPMLIKISRGENIAMSIQNFDPDNELSIIQ